jgi:hypothetical protein
MPLSLPEVPAVEVGWRIHPRQWRQACDGGRPREHHAGIRSADLDRIISIAEPGNEASVRVMRKLGITEALRTTHPSLGGTLTTGVALTVDEAIRSAAAEVGFRAWTSAGLMSTHDVICWLVVGRRLSTEWIRRQFSVYRIG